MVQVKCQRGAQDLLVTGAVAVERGPDGLGMAHGGGPPAVLSSREAQRVSDVSNYHDAI